MRKYLDNLPSDTTLNISTKNFITPCSISLFRKNDQSPELTEDVKDNFHTQVAKLLYLSKRGRPDICLPVGYLTTTVCKPRQEDWDKLMRIL